MAGRFRQFLIYATAPPATPGVPSVGKGMGWLHSSRMAKRGSAKRLITVFSDEFKVHISRPFMTSLGAAAGWGMHCILAFQSLQDLADVPADLDKDSVRGAVMENCAIQGGYRIKDPETAEWLAAATGPILVDDEARKIERNLALSETVLAERTVRMAERFLIDTNMLMNLPAGCGVLSGASALPSFCYTSPVRAAKQPQAVTAVAVAGFTKRTAPPAQPSNASAAPFITPSEEMAAPVREVFVAKPRQVLVDEDDFL
ncbi:MAG: Mobilization protein TriK [Candidatus Gallionella acididurans]|uniref:Mobilization protein TriK n=1 Tax=Candidatus Gallionella acididurans TaxID=1796491 RepID=A0A139BPC1_9PROT|nr:MAG: Mobilization protein TriK [Candidatus Gallionella acididurans]